MLVHQPCKNTPYSPVGPGQLEQDRIGAGAQVQGDQIDQDYLSSWAEKLGVREELELVRRKLSEREE